MGFVVPLVYFLLANATLVYISKRTFGKCIPITMMLVAFLMFFSQIIFKTFSIGFYLNIVIAIIPIILLIKNRNNKDIINEFKKNYFSKGLLAFLIIYLCIFILDFSRCFTSWDEKSHWGVMIKEMLRLDQFYSVPASTLMVHKDYPPILQLFELFWVKLCGTYQECYLIRSLHVFELSLFIPAISELTKKAKSHLFTITNTVAMILLVFLSILFFDQHAIVNSIYNDYFMAILIAYAIFSIMIEKDRLSNFTLISLSVTSSFLLLTKQIGLPLYLMIIFFYTVVLILDKKIKMSNLKKLINKTNILKFIKVIILLIVIPLAFWKGWSCYVDTLDAPKQFVLSDIKVTELAGIIKGSKGATYQHEAAINYFSAIRKKNITTSVIQLSYFQSLVLVLLLLFVIWSIGKKQVDKKEFISLIVTIILGAIGYAFVMLNMYVFSFGSFEGPRLASFDRYMSTYIIIITSIIIMLYIWINSQKEHQQNYKIWMIVAILFLIQSPVKTAEVFPKLLKTPADNFELTANSLVKQVEKTAKVYLIAENTAGEAQYYIKYYANPITTNLDYFNLPTDKKDTKKFFDKKVNNYMLKFDYVYIYSITDEFSKKYKFLFPEKVKEKQLYKVTTENKKVKLTLVK